MKSLFDELIERINQDPRLTKRGGARADLGLLLHADREALGALWKAADRCIRLEGAEPLGELRAAVEKLRPLFGERSAPR
jgi:hypothetical protein